MTVSLSFSVHIVLLREIPFNFIRLFYCRLSACYRQGPGLAFCLTPNVDFVTSFSVKLMEAEQNRTEPFNSQISSFRPFIHLSVGFKELRRCHFCSVLSICVRLVLVCFIPTYTPCFCPWACLFPGPLHP